jgi:hypothetical protein
MSCAQLQNLCISRVTKSNVIDENSYQIKQCLLCLVTLKQITKIFIILLFFSKNVSLIKKKKLYVIKQINRFANYF